jgi:hypothetical protein
MPPAQAILHISAICFVGASLFAVIEWFKPYRPLAIVLKCAILAAGVVTIATQLLP